MHDPLSDTGTIVQAMAKELFTSASEQMPEWAEVFYDHRESSESGTGFYRTIGRSETTRKWLDEPVRLFNLRDTLWEIRPAAGPDRWYGLSIHIQRSGEVDVKFDYDPDCIESFDDDELNQRPF